MSREEPVRIRFPDPWNVNVQLWIDRTICFIEENYQGSGLSPKLLTTLKKLNAIGNIVIRDMGSQKLGGFYHLNKKLSLNASKFVFVRRDFGRQLTDLAEHDDPRRTKLVQAQFEAAILELSGVLIHEGAHAQKYIWCARDDETAAFSAEQIWYRHLHGLESDHHERILSLSRSAEDDAKSASSYKLLGIDVASFFER